MASRERNKKRNSRTSDQPEFILKMKSRDRDQRGSSKIGVGWTNSAGGISLKLDMGVTISFRDCEDHIFTLWPVEEEEDYG